MVATGVEAVVADGLLAFRWEVEKSGGDEVGGFADLEVALGGILQLLREETLGLIFALSSLRAVLFVDFIKGSHRFNIDPLVDCVQVSDEWT